MAESQFDLHLSVILHCLYNDVTLTCIIHIVSRNDESEIVAVESELAVCLYPNKIKIVTPVYNNGCHPPMRLN